MAAPLGVRGLAFLACVPALALLRHGYGLRFALVMCLGMVARALLGAWLLPVFAPSSLLSTYATILVGLNTVAALGRTAQGTTIPARYTGHSWLWTLLSTRAMMLVVEPLLAAGMAVMILAGWRRGYGLLPLQWPYDALLPMLGPVPLSPALRAWLGVWGVWIATAQALLLPVALWIHNKAEYDALPGPVEPPHPATAHAPALTFPPVYAAAAPRLPVPSAARLAGRYAARYAAPPSP